MLILTKMPLKSSMVVQAMASKDNFLEVAKLLSTWALQQHQLELEAVSLVVLRINHPAV